MRDRDLGGDEPGLHGLLLQTRADVVMNELERISFPQALRELRVVVHAPVGSHRVIHIRPVQLILE